MVSVIICCFEGDRAYLKKAISSVMVQDVPTEIIVVDASNTPMDEGLHKFVTGVTDYFITVDNLGQCHSLNTGIIHSNHELILPVDADDYLMPDVLGKMISAMNSEFDIVFGNCRNQYGDVSIPYGKDGVTKDAFMLCNPIFFTSLFKKDVWKRDGFKDIVFTDYRFYVDAYKNLFKFRYIDLLVYQHTRREGSITFRHEHETDKLNKEAIQPLL